VPINPLKYPREWDRILIGGTPSPGKCSVGKPKRSYEWDVKRGKGVQGATTTYQGLAPAEFTVTFRLITTPGVTGSSADPDDFADWNAFLPLLKYDPTKKTVQAVDIFHPTLADLDIKAVVVKGIVAPHELNPFTGDGKYEAEVDFLEYVPAPSANATQTPNGAAGTMGTNPKVPAQPPATLTAEQILAQLQAQAMSPT
jgi:hypothetical protein